MKTIYILCVDDEPEVLEAVERDLASFESVFRLESASSAEEARSILGRIVDADGELGVVFCDHIMPKETGVEFLKWLDAQPRWSKARKALLTGQAGHMDTIEAINQAGLDFYIQKPWTKEGLTDAAKDLLTRFVIESEMNPLPFMSILDGQKLAESINRRGLLSDE